MFKIKTVSVIPSQIGNGLKIGDTIIGCAKITNVDFGTNEDGSDNIFIDAMEENGLVVGINNINENHNVLFNNETLENSKNFVLVSEKNGEVSVITDTKMITDIFGLPDEDAEMLSKYIGVLAESKQLIMKTAEDLDGNEFMFFVNSLDDEISSDFYEGEIETASNKYVSMLSHSQYYADYNSDNFIKMFLIGLINAGQDRYNKVHREDILVEVAEKLKSIKYFDNGELCTPSIADVEEFCDKIKSIIRL